MVDENMANAGRVHAVENGKDLAEFTMITFGGGGPLHAARVCDKMGIRSFLVPPGAGVGSAIGFLRAPFGYEAVRTSLVRLTDVDARRVYALLDAMTAEALSFVKEGLDGAVPIIERTAFMRYAGQGWDIPVSLPEYPFTDDPRVVLQGRFDEAYTRFFGRPNEGIEVEVVSWSVRASSPPRQVKVADPIKRTRTIAPTQRRTVFDGVLMSPVSAGIYERSSLAVGDVIEGPAIVVEAETSTVIPSSFIAVLQSDRCILVTRPEQQPRRANSGR
jgi:N-methylhydantoinase A